ncbi:MAG: mechanosensitive ion channel family protein [Chloroflexota bacterium]
MEIDQGLLDDLSGVGVLVVVLAAGLVVHTIVFAVLGRIAARSETHLDEAALAHIRDPTRLLFAVAAIFVALPFTAGDADAKELIRRTDLFIGLLGLGWLAVALTNVGYDAAMSRFPTDVEDNLEARTMQTQLRILQRFGIIIIWLVAIALALLTIPGVQALAASMLAGAGVIGIVLGVAAGPLIGNLIAGIQIAFTQPIRVDDVVVIEGEWGRIGEITAAYVVVDIWDKRQLVVPLSKIVNSPIENWTRDSADVLGTVTIYTDYRADIEGIRTELKRILEASGMWDGVAYSVLVTDASESTIKVRALMSAPDSGNAWDLRCLVREKLIAYLHEKDPEALPTRREIQHQVGASDGTA